jgi:hypothetical protein
MVTEDGLPDLPRHCTKAQFAELSAALTRLRGLKKIYLMQPRWKRRQWHSEASGSRPRQELLDRDRNPAAVLSAGEEA